MKRFGTISVIAGLLFATALMYRFRAVDDTDEQTSGGVSPIRQPTSLPGVKPAEPKPSALTPRTHGSADGTLSMAAGTSHGYLASGTDQDLYAAVDISAQDLQSGRRPPLNLAVVIDRSGSMNGEKIKYAKRAARQLVDDLGADDRLAIVTYASLASLEVASRRATGVGKRTMRSAIDRISPGGGTNIGAGYKRGLQAVEGSKTEKSINRVVLLSDGNPTVGLTRPSGLQRVVNNGRLAGVSLTTMGAGLSYNEDLMAAMADQGGGNYYFIDTPGAIVSLFEEEFDGLAATVASQAKVVVSVGEGVEVTDLFGFSFDRVGDQIVAPLAEFHAGEQKSILMKLAVQAGPAGAQPIMDVDLTYRDIPADAARRRRLSLMSVRTDDVAKTTTAVNVGVVSRVQQVAVARSLEEATAAYQEGNRQQAQKVLRQRQHKLRKARKTYHLEARSFRRADGELARAADDMGRVPEGSDTGKHLIKSTKARGRKILRDRSTF